MHKYSTLIKEIASLYNSKINATPKFHEYVQQNEANLVLTNLYNKLIHQQIPQSVAYSELLNHLNQDGLSTITDLSQNNDVMEGLNSLANQGSYLSQWKNNKKKNHEFLQKSEQQILGSSEILTLLYKIYLHQIYQISNLQIIEHLGNQIKIVQQLPSRELIIYATIVSKWLTTLGYMKPLAPLIHKLDFLIRQAKLTNEEKSYLLILINNKIEIPSKRDCLCQLEDLSFKEFENVFSAWANNYWDKMDVKQKEDEIMQHMEEITQPLNLIQGLMYCQSENTELLKNLFNKIEIPKHNIEKCRLYQILYCFERLYNVELQFEQREQLKQLYFNRTNMKNTSDFSITELDVYRELIELQQDQSSRQQYKITQIKRNINVEVFTLDFQVSLEGTYRKRLLYLDVVTSRLNQGRNQLRYRMLKNEEVKLISDWDNIKDKKEYLKSLLYI